MWVHLQPIQNGHPTASGNTSHAGTRTGQSEGSRTRTGQSERSCTRTGQSEGPRVPRVDGLIELQRLVPEPLSVLELHLCTTTSVIHPICDTLAQRPAGAPLAAKHNTVQVRTFRAASFFARTVSPGWWMASCDMFFRMMFALWISCGTRRRKPRSSDNGTSPTAAEFCDFNLFRDHRQVGLHTMTITSGVFAPATSD
jgi:hypothetical protein